jgi:hypothetical protein
MRPVNYLEMLTRIFKHSEFYRCDVELVDMRSKSAGQASDEKIRIHIYYVMNNFYNP